MTQPTIQPTILHYSNRYPLFQPYQNKALWGGIATAWVTVLNPVLGGALGAYCVTDIGVNLIADYFELCNDSPVAKVAKIALACLAGLAVSYSVLCSLTGAIVPLSPVLLGGGIGLVSISLLNTIRSLQQVRLQIA